MNVIGPGFQHKDLVLPLLGDYQPINAGIAVASAHLLDRVSDDAVRQGLRSTRWPGRLQVIAHQPRVILDGGHNPAAMMKAGTALRRLIGTERLGAVFALLRGGGPAHALDALRPWTPDPT